MKKNNRNRKVEAKEKYENFAYRISEARDNNSVAYFENTGREQVFRFCSINDNSKLFLVLNPGEGIGINTTELNLIRKWEVMHRYGGVAG